MATKSTSVKQVASEPKSAKAESTSAKATPKPSKTDESVKVINDNVVIAMAAGLIPIPGADLAAIAAVQVKLVSNLCDLYNVPFQEEKVRSVVTGLIGATGTIAISRGAIGSFIKTIPVVGTIGGMILMPTTAGAATYAIGRLFVKHFETGHDLVTFNTDNLRAHFNAFFLEGKKIAASLKTQL